MLHWAPGDGVGGAGGGYGAAVSKQTINKKKIQSSLQHLLPSPTVCTQLLSTYLLLVRT